MGMSAKTTTVRTTIAAGAASRLPTRRAKQSGATLLVMLTLIILAGASVVLGKLNSRAQTQLDQQLRTAQALSAAKAALLAYAVTYPDNYGDRWGPGYLPCPDTDNDGTPDPDPDDLYASSILRDCGADAIGRLPESITTDVDDVVDPLEEEEVFGATGLRDAAGERLWYAVSDDFHHDPNDPAGPSALNSETLGALILDGVSAADEKVVALIFAPGSELESQDRESDPNSVANYLEGDNASVGDQSFVSTNASIDFNDRVIAITHADLMTAVEKRVMAELSGALEDYKNTYGKNSVEEPVFYPWLSPFVDPITDELAGVAVTGSSATTLAVDGVSLIELGVRIGDVVRNESDDSMGIIDDVTVSTLSVAGLAGGTNNSFSVGDLFRISRFNGVIGVNEGQVPFHAVDEPFKTEYVVDWNLQDTNGVIVTTTAATPTYQTMLENFVESTAWSGPVKVPIEQGTCVWTVNSAAGVKCNGIFSMTFFEGKSTKTHTSELEDKSRHFDAWGVVPGAIVENVSDGSTGIVNSINDNTLILQNALAGGIENQFAPLDQYRVRVPANSTEVATFDSVIDGDLVDADVDFVALGVEVGDTIHNKINDEWGLITSVEPDTLQASITFATDDEYVVRYDFIETRQYTFSFNYKGQVDEHGVGGRKARDVCSNDGPASEPDGLLCELNATATSGSGGLTLIDSAISNLALAGVGVGDLVINETDGQSSGIIESISGSSLTVLSLNGGNTNQFTLEDKIRIHLREDMNDLPFPDVSNDDLAKVEIRDLDSNSIEVGSASAEVPATGTVAGSIYVSDLFTDLEIQADAGDTSYDLPLWFSENKWHRLLYVAASKSVLPDNAVEPPDACLSTIEPDRVCLMVEGLTPDDDKEVLVIAAGRPLATQDRLAGSLCGALEPSFFCDYFEGENADFDFDEGDPPPPPTFEHSPIGDTFNDQVRIVEFVEPPAE